MRTIITLLPIVFCFVSIHLFAQDTRLFYQTQSNQANYNFIVAERDGVSYFFSIKEADGVFAKLAYGPMDTQTLSPISYHYVTLPVLISELQFLNGVNVVGNRLDLVIQSKITTTTSKFDFVEIDLQSNTVINSSSTENNYRTSFFRARSINQRLVLYGLNISTKKMIRFEKEVTGTYVTDTIPEVFNNVGIAANITEIKVVNNEEYICVVATINSVSLIKRNTTGSYVVSSPISTGSSYIRRWDFIPFENNSFLFLGAKKAIVLSDDLSVISESDLDFMDNSLGYNRKAVFRNNELYVYDAESRGSVVKMDLSFNLIESYKFDRQVFPFDIISIGNDVWMIGKTMDGAGVLNHHQCSSLIIDRNCSMTPIEEHHRTLTINDLVFNIGNYSRLFPATQFSTSSMRYGGNEISNPALIFESSDNLLGKNENDELVGIWSRYTIENKLLPGPIFSSVADSNLQWDKYNRSYYVTAQMISDHVAHTVTYGNSNYGMPNGIKYWPGNGNTANGESHKIADFIDVNGNGIYEPHLGEFPKIYGDKCLLTVFHQSKADTMENSLEVHRYLFAYDCDTSEVLKNTLFCNVRYINRGTDINDVYVGSFTDYDLGYSNDDYVGTHVGLGMTYVYNGDTFDESNASQVGFHDSIPAMGQIILSGSKKKDDGIDNAFGVSVGESINGVGFGDGVIDNEFLTLESSFHVSMYHPNLEWGTPVGFYNVLRGLEPDGTPQLYGAVGPYAALGQSDPEFYATGGVPHSNDYSEFNIGNAPGDRRILSGSGPGVLLSGDTLNYLTAHVLSFGTQNDPNGPSVGQLFTDAAKIKSYFANNDLGCGKTFDLSDESLNLKKIEKLDFAVYPNPFKDELFIRHDIQGEVQLTIRNLNGQEVYRQGGVGNQQSISIDLTSGIYLVELNSSKGNSIKKIVRR